MVVAAMQRDNKAYFAATMDVQELGAARSPQPVELCDAAIAH